MTGWVAFEGRVEPLAWGRATYTVLRLPPEVVAALGPACRVAGEVADHPIEAAPARAPVIEDPFLYLSRRFLAEAGLSPGEAVEVRLRPADPDAVDTPPDVAAALRASGRTAGWEALTPGRRRGLLHAVTTARRPETRARRIETLLRGF